MDDEVLVEMCRALYAQKPEWSIGSLSAPGSEFLARCLLSSGADRVVEIGMASGYSTALMASVLQRRVEEGELDSWEVLSFDVTDRFYGDTSRRAGDVARELVPDLVAAISFNYFKTAADVSDVVAPESIGFLFIDGSHKHPWPTLDLLLTLPCLRPGATVVLDDINLPLIRPEFPSWGAHHLFRALNVEKTPGPLVSPAGLASMGSVRVPQDKSELSRQLIEILDDLEWEIDVPPLVQQRVSSSTNGAWTVRSAVP